MKISELKANPNNPRVVKDAKFAKAVNSLLCFPKMLPKRKMIIEYLILVPEKTIET